MSRAVPGAAAEQFLDQAHLRDEFEAIFEFPHVEAALIWGDPAVGHVTINDVDTAFTCADDRKALVQKVGTAKCDCAKTM